ncbi:hypothetical protein LFAB_17155 [Lactiplantibacillus fabifermentans T30PCM01]|uniref:AttH domain-containing protein n=1 Tax=Lactiplantibacillus fabifermentans T30PCM01 TaxID=1400520 RepID=W6T3Y5_9LACO|nr:lipocalin-like domain-containing protein [Lactiplantibacillus fabifermentans]ETY72622.1 hypothetical protein LFAB_17155 [Lactiplantibacillus fabifermentans T30PCM01]
MENARLMDQPQDFKKFGIDPHQVALWEDGIRNTEAVGQNEVWYFDADLDDGSKVVIGFRPKTMATMKSGGYSPNLNLAITRPDGTTSQEFAFADMDHTQMSADKCDVHFGPDYCTGDFTEYDVHVESTANIACDLHYHALVEPFRQGTAALALGDNDDYYYTDLSVPKCAVTGTLTYDGQTVTVNGQGYHDHQWMNISPMAAFHHWFWGRMYTDKYVIYLYDFVTSERFSFKRLPLFMVADNQTGKIIFTTNGQVAVNTELEPTSVGKAFPKTSHYVFNNGDDRAEFEVTWQDIIETRDMYHDAPKDQAEALALAKKAGLSDMQNVMGGTQAQYDQAGLQPAYLRFFAKGGIKLSLNGQTTSSTGTMLYEYNYMGREDPRADV